MRRTKCVYNPWNTRRIGGGNDRRIRRIYTHSRPLARITRVRKCAVAPARSSPLLFIMYNADRHADILFIVGIYARALGSSIHWRFPFRFPLPAPKRTIPLLFARNWSTEGQDNARATQRCKEWYSLRFHSPAFLKGCPSQGTEPDMFEKIGSRMRGDPPTLFRIVSRTPITV